MKKDYSLTVIKPADKLDEESLSSIYGGTCILHLTFCKPNSEQDSGKPSSPAPTTSTQSGGQGQAQPATGGSTQP